MAIKTNKEFIFKTLEKFNLSEDDVDLILAENPELDEDGSLDVKACKLAMYKSMSAILPVMNVSEGGYSISWLIDALKMWYSALCKELGKEDVLAAKKRKVRDKSNYW